MLFKEVLDTLLRAIPPKTVHLERPKEGRLVIIFTGVRQGKSTETVFFSILVLVMGIIIAFRGVLGNLDGNLFYIAAFLYIGIGGGICWWAVHQLINVNYTTLTRKRWLELSLTMQGGRLYEGTMGKKLSLTAHFDWVELAAILSAYREKRLGELRKSPPVQYYKIVNLLEKELQGQEAIYGTNIMTALCQWHETGKISTNWNYSSKQQPTKTDYSKHLVN